MLFETSTPKKRTITPTPRSSTPNQFYTLIKNKIDVTDDRVRIKTEYCCQHSQISMIKLDSLLYRPKPESKSHRSNRKQIWNI